MNLKVVLDTTAADWSAEWFVDDVLVRGPVAYGTQPVINWVGFGKFSSASGTVDNFSLSAVAAPEPGTGALLGMAALGALAAFRPARGRDGSANTPVRDLPMADRNVRLTPRSH